LDGLNELRESEFPLHSSSLWHESQSVDVAGPEEAKLAAVQRRDLGLVQSLDDRQNCRVDESEVGIGIPIANLADPTIILRHQVLNSISR